MGKPANGPTARRAPEFRHTEGDRIEQIVSQHDSDTHPYTAKYAAELPAEDWAFVREHMLEEMRARVGLQLVARAAVETALAADWAEEGYGNLVDNVHSRFCESIAGGNIWAGAIHRPDVDQIVDACFDVLYAAEAAFLGEPAPKRIRQR